MRILIFDQSLYIATPETVGGRIWHYRGQRLPKATEVSLLALWRWILLPRRQFQRTLENHKQALAASRSLSSQCICHILRSLGALPKHPFVDQGILKNMSTRRERDDQYCLLRAAA